MSLLAFHMTVRVSWIRWSCLLLWVLVSIPVQSQNLEHWLEKADQAWLEKSYSEAIKYYDWAAKKGSDPRPLVGLGKCYRALRDHAKAAEYFEAATNYPNLETETYFYLAQSLLTVHRRDDAKKWFDIYS